MPTTTTTRTADNAATTNLAGGPGMPKAFEAVIELRALGDLKPSPRNARTHSPKQIQKIAASIKEFGFLAPILVAEDDAILAGHGRVEAARLLGLSHVPTVPVRHLTASRKRAFMLADNRLAELAGWDEELLGIELRELSALEMDFELEITGFDTVDLDRLDTPIAKATAQETVPPLDRELRAVSAPGDLWRLGQHLLLCGNALDEQAYQQLMGEERAQMVFTDPPYNVKIDGHVCGLGSVKHHAFKMAAGEMSEGEFTRFLGTAMKLMADYSLDGAIHDICMDWRHIGEVLAAARPIYGDYKNLCVWNKSNGGMGTFYRSKYELVFIFKVGNAPHINNFGLGERGRYRTNVWDYAGVNTFKPGRMAELATHPTVKPLPLVIDAIKDCSTRRGIVLDPFAGSGTTLLAAEKTGRVARAIELDPHYVDAAVKRWQTLTGKVAIHAKTGTPYDGRVARQFGPAIQGDNHVQ